MREELLFEVDDEGHPIDSIDENGFPVVLTTEGKWFPIAQMMLENFLGRALESDETFRQSCDNKLCLNPDHLFVDEIN